MRTYLVVVFTAGTPSVNLPVPGLLPEKSARSAQETIDSVLASVYWTASIRSEVTFRTDSRDDFENDKSRTG